jgi:crossover junction endodeoxyribonuclease RuvC
MIVLGVDPGFQVTGYGILKKDGNKAYLLDHGYLKLPASKSLVVRIGMFHDFFTEKIMTWKVTDIALETPFLGKNAQNFLKLGYLRGNLYLLANQHNANILEFSPREIKQSITGFGGASKEQVARVVQQLFPGLKDPKKLDVTDALAVTLCGFWATRSLLTKP